MERFIGIDVAKATLDLAVVPGEETWTVPNDAAGLAELLPRLAGLQPTLLVLEATGGFEHAVVAALAHAGLPVVVVNPRQGTPQACATSAARWAASPRPTRSTP